jgi:hypothetical protein
MKGRLCHQSSLFLRTNNNVNRLQGVLKSESLRIMTGSSMNSCCKVNVMVSNLHMLLCQSVGLTPFATFLARSRRTGVKYRQRALAQTGRRWISSSTGQAPGPGP